MFEDTLIQEEELPGQLAFFPEEEHPAPQLTAEIQLPELPFLDVYRLRILIGDILMRFHGMLRRDWLYAVMVEKIGISYFVYADAVGALLDNGTAAEVHDEEGNDCIALTPAAMQQIPRLRSVVPKLFRDQAHIKAIRYVNRQIALRDLSISYEDTGDGCLLCMSCMENGREMIGLRLRAGSRDDAESLAEHILCNPAGFFGRLIDLALTNTEKPFDLTDN